MIRLESVDFHRGIARLPALSGLSFGVPEGGFRWIAGPAGSGKSSLISLLGMRHPPDAGRLCLFGVDIGRARQADLARLRRRMGVIDEERRLLPNLSVLENTALPLRVSGLSTASARIDALEMLDWVGLGPVADRPAALLSGGERLLCAVARAIVGRPDLLLADEPTAGLGEADGDRLLQLLLELNRLGATVLVATRNAALARSHPATILTLDGGRLREVSP